MNILTWPPNIEVVHIIDHVNRSKIMQVNVHVLIKKRLGNHIQESKKPLPVKFWIGYRALAKAMKVNVQPSK